MIGHMAYVACDDCGAAAGLGDSALEARAEARRHGFTRDGSRDLCATCADPKTAP